MRDVDTGADVPRTCTAITGGDGLPSVAAAFRNGDVRPPDFFHTVTVHEYAPRGYDTVLQDGQSAYIRFDDEQVRDSVVTTYVVVDGKVFIYAYLDRFTASYLKAAAQCGFDGTGVVD